MALAMGTTPGSMCHPCPSPCDIAGLWLDIDEVRESAQGFCLLPLGDTDCRLGIISWQMGHPRACPALSPRPQIALGSIFGWVGGVLLHSTDP